MKDLVISFARKGLQTLLFAGVVIGLYASAFCTSRYRVLAYFNDTNGAGPWGGVTLNQGKLYGTTAGGGSGNACNGGCGVVFEVTPRSGGKWTESVLYNF